MDHGKSSSNKNYKVWRHHKNHPVALNTNSMVDERINYIYQTR
jgi:hypothetical protein